MPHDDNEQEGSAPSGMEAAREYRTMSVVEDDAADGGPIAEAGGDSHDRQTAARANLVGAVESEASKLGAERERRRTTRDMADIRRVIGRAV